VLLTVDVLREHRPDSDVACIALESKGMIKIWARQNRRVDQGVFDVCERLLTLHSKGETRTFPCQVGERRHHGRKIRHEPPLPTHHPYQTTDIANTLRRRHVDDSTDLSRVDVETPSVYYIA
jgi:hypothetical protein